MTDNSDKIDTNDYKSLYPYQDRKKYGRFRELPDIQLRIEVKEVLRKIESGEEDEKKDDIFNH